MITSPIAQLLAALEQRLLHRAARRRRCRWPSRGRAAAAGRRRPAPARRAGARRACRGRRGRSPLAAEHERAVGGQLDARSRRPGPCGRSATSPPPHPATAPDPSSLRSLTCSWSGENGVAMASSAPSAATWRRPVSRPGPEQDDLGVARHGVAAQLAGDTAVADDASTSTTSGRRSRASLRASSSVVGLEHLAPGARSPPRRPRAPLASRPASSTIAALAARGRHRRSSSGSTTCPRPAARASSSVGMVVALLRGPTA